jgi:hypothetical protein
MCFSGSTKQTCILCFTQKRNIQKNDLLVRITQVPISNKPKPIYIYTPLAYIYITLGGIRIHNPNKLEAADEHVITLQASDD